MRKASLGATRRNSLATLSYVGDPNQYGATAGARIGCTPEYELKILGQRLGQNWGGQLRATP